MKRRTNIKPFYYWIKNAKYITYIYNIKQLLYLLHTNIFGTYRTVWLDRNRELSSFPSGAINAHTHWSKYFHHLLLPCRMTWTSEYDAFIFEYTNCMCILFQFTYMYQSLNFISWPINYTTIFTVFTFHCKDAKRNKSP